MVIDRVRKRVKEKEKQCTYCERTFTKEEHLKRHQRTHTGEKPFKCHKCDRQYGRSDVLARHLQTHSATEKSKERYQPSNFRSDAEQLPTRHTRTHDEFEPLNDVLDNSTQSTFFGDQVFDNSANNHYPLAHDGPRQGHLNAHNLDHNGNGETYQDPSELWSLLPSTNNAAISELIPQPEPQPIRLPSEFGSRARHHSSSSVAGVWHRTTQDVVSEAARRNWDVAAALTEADREAVPGGEADSSEERAQDIGDRPFTDHHDTRLPSLPPSLRNGSCEEGNSSSLPAGPTVNFAFGQGIMDYIDFPSTLTPSLPYPIGDQSGHIRSFLSVEQLHKIQCLWHGQRSAPSVQLMRSLWSTAVQHQADSIFSDPLREAFSVSQQGPSTRQWQIDERRRKDLMDFCKEPDNKTSCEDQVELTPRSAPIRSPSSSSDVSSLPGVLIDGFPSLETLEASLDFYFQYFPFVFVHKATFDARVTPSSMLFPMCLIGLSSLYGERSRAFVVRYLKRMMRFCRDDLTSKALGHCEPWSLLMSIVSTLLVTYLALGYLDEIDHSQAHMLCSQLLHVAEKHGLFAAKLGEDMAQQLRRHPSETILSWKAWARVESSKRIAHYLLLLDSAYARIHGSAAVVDVDKVEIYLPCEAALFETSDSIKFQELCERGSRSIMPSISLQDFESAATDLLDNVSLQIILSMFYLRISAERHRLPVVDGIGIGTQSFSPAEAFAKDPTALCIVNSILRLPSLSLRQIQGGDTMNALAWNNLGLSLTVDMDLLEIASGRRGLGPAQTAMATVAKWSQSASARRAILHASQIFSILSSVRLRGSNIARSDLLLFTSALVLSMYLFVIDREDHDRELPPFELLHEVDWTVVGGEGLLHPPKSFSPPQDEARSQMPKNPALQFIRYGGPVSFAGGALNKGMKTARKILANYVHLLDELGKWRGSTYSQLLRNMSDFAIERTSDHD